MRPDNGLGYHGSAGERPGAMYDFMLIDFFSTPPLSVRPDSSEERVALSGERVRSEYWLAQVPGSTPGRVFRFLLP